MTQQREQIQRKNSLKISVQDNLPSPSLKTLVLRNNLKYFMKARKLTVIIVSGGTVLLQLLRTPSGCLLFLCVWVGTQLCSDL